MSMLKALAIASGLVLAVAVQPAYAIEGSESVSAAVASQAAVDDEATEALFVDVDDTTPHADDISWVASSGIAQGWEVGGGASEFRPYASVARCDMAAFLYRLAGSPEFDASATSTDFSDVDEDTPHYKEIAWLAYQGISTGFPDGTFRPYDSVARCDMAAFLYRLKGSPSFKESAWSGYFSDVSEATPHYKEVLWLAANGISAGWTGSDGFREFRNNGQVARCDMAAFMHRSIDKTLSVYYFDSLNGEVSPRLVQTNVSEYLRTSTGQTLHGTVVVQGIVYLVDTGGHLQEIDAQSIANSGLTPIMGASEATPEQMARCYRRSGATYPVDAYEQKGAPTIDDFCTTLCEVAQAEGVRADVVFAQVMNETGWLSFGGDVKAEQCNFGGVGASGNGNPGVTFSDVREGLLAQAQHLKAYASLDAVSEELVDPRFGYVSRGCAPVVEWLGSYDNPFGQGWATSRNYGSTIKGIMAML